MKHSNNTAKLGNTSITQPSSKFHVSFMFSFVCFSDAEILKFDSADSIGIMKYSAENNDILDDKR
jgi:hypothetical protein